jgi:hypothetical protein
MKSCVLFGGFLMLAAVEAYAAGLQARIPTDVEVTLHEPVIADLIFSNAGPSVDVDTGQNGERGFVIAIVRPNGELVKAGLPYWATQAEALVEIDMTHIRPGQSFKRPVLLNQWFPFNEVGRYHVTVSVPGVEGTADFRVNIAARDETRLRAVCETLLKDATSFESPRRFEAARTLGFVADDLAIPYMARLASATNGSSGLGLEGLVRIGDTQAVSALASLLHNNDDAIRRQASGYLGIMLMKSGDDRVKRAITSALNDPSGK